MKERSVKPAHSSLNASDYLPEETGIEITPVSSVYIRAIRLVVVSGGYLNTTAHGEV